MTKQEYLDWKSSPGTIEVFAEMRNRVEGLKEELANTAGENARLDGIKVGAIAAYNDILATTYDEVME